MSAPESRKPSQAKLSCAEPRSRILLLAPFAVLLAILAARSLTWRIEHDLPLAHYSAFMHAEYGTKPYEQLFEISFPGTILVHLGITSVFGYGDRGLMVANAVWFAALAGVTWALMRRFGRVVAAGAVTFFGLAYFASGQGMMMQRDCILILFIAAALVVHAREFGRELGPTAGRAIVGLLIGAAAAIKPHAAVALLPILVDDLSPMRLGRAGRALFAYGAGFAVPWACVFAWLLAAGGFSGWLEMSRSYLPLYLHMTGDHKTIQGTARILDLACGFLAFGEHTAWFLGAGAGAAIALTRIDRHSPDWRVGRLLLGEALAFAVYPVFAGQFWSYHYMPFVYFLTLLASLCLVRLASPHSTTEALLPKVALLVSLLANGAIVTAAARLGRQEAVGYGEVDEMAAFLEGHLRPGDTVQPLDWTGGAVHAMLIARARLATRFMYDYHFYHHVSNPFVKLLRRRFIGELEAAEPRFFIEYFGADKPWPEGDDTTRDFPELRRFIASNYAIALAATNYRIYERDRSTSYCTACGGLESPR